MSCSVAIEVLNISKCLSISDLDLNIFDLIANFEHPQINSFNKFISI